ncbi:hypothetical protein CRYUN_Cryun19dG0054500 [Craigia yunnanensis]
MSTFNISPRWTKPKLEWYKCNVDAAVFSHENCIGIGCIVKDEADQMVAAKNSKLRGDVDPVIAEAISCREALSWLKSLGFNKVVIKLDDQVVVQAKLGAKEDPSYFGSIIKDCIRIC